MPELDVPEESAPPLDWGVAMDEKAAKAYHGTLSTEEKQIPTGCYCVRCVSCGGCPVGASLNINCGTCIYPVLSTFIFRRAVSRLDLSPEQRRRTQNMVFYAISLITIVLCAVIWANEIQEAALVASGFAVEARLC